MPATCSGILNAAQYRRKSDWTCDTCSAPLSQQWPLPILSHAPNRSVTTKLSPKSKNHCIRNYTTVRKDRPHGQGGGLLISIHRSLTFPKQPPSPVLLSDPHMEELYIQAELGNTKLIISNVYIPPARSCNNGYQSSIENFLTTQDTIILGDFNAHHPSWYSRSTATRGRKMTDSINGSD